MTAATAARATRSGDLVMDRTDRTQGQPEPGGPAAHQPAGGSAGSPPAPLTPPAPLAPARIVTLTAGDFTLTVNPVDGSEIEPLRPTAAPAAGRGPAKRDAASRAARDTAARPPALPGPPAPAAPSWAAPRNGSGSPGCWGADAPSG